MKQKLGKYLCSLLVTMSIIISSAVGIIPGMSTTAQAATTLTDTFTTNTGATEYTGDYSKVSGYVWIGATNKALALTDPNTFGTTKYGGPITIETLNGEIIDKVVLSGVSNPQNAYVHPSSGNVTNTLKSGDCCYNLNDDGAIEIENINSTTLTISFHPGYGGTCFYANVVVYCHEVPVDITGVELNKTSTALTVGETDTLTATVNPDNSDHTVAWSSDNESVATVSDGVVTAVAEGTATITVTATNGTDDTSDDKTATCTVTVNAITFNVTYSVVNGTWSDGTTADKTETVQNGSAPASVPSGMIADSGFTGGSWNADPSSATITGDTTFTYTFEAIPTYTVTYSVVNGTWSDGTTADKTETVQSGSTPASVPSGMIADSGFTGGSWDTDPASATITGDTTFTYTYAAKTPISYTVTFNVENGSWNNGVSDAQTVTLTGYEGDILTLAASQIPAVGSNPDATYKAGFWDTTPTAGMEITADTTFTYTYVEENTAPITYTNTEGEGSNYTLGTNGTLTFRFSRSENDAETINHFTGIKVDNIEVSSSNYTYSAGSVIINLKPEYLQTLSVGQHTLTAMFDDGGDVTVNFTIVAAAQNTPTPTPAPTPAGTAIASTGETFPMTVLYGIAMLIASALCIAVMSFIKPKKYKVRKVKL